MKVYIRSAGNISPQHSLEPELFFSKREIYSGSRMKAIEPDYSLFVDSKMIRRMSRIVKMGVASALVGLRNAATDMPEAIVTGTAYGCLEDTGVFLRRMIDNGEELLTPTAFIQSTHNTVGAQIALLLKCHGYNNTIVHRGFSFENALIDASLLLQEGMNNVLVGGIDEITDDSHAILSRFHIYGKGNNADFQNKKFKGTIGGEGSSFFLLNNKAVAGTLAELSSLKTIYKPESAAAVEEEIQQFLEESSLKPEDLDLILTGSNGDETHDAIDQYLSARIFKNIPAYPFKLVCGEYPTASAFAVWLAATLAGGQKIPDWFTPLRLPLRKILIHNHDMNNFHSLFLISAC
ncbi:MAG TPA: beta-ketoacyl synthase chain length factor [Puia sp.]|jgi:3-oxoacyl-(acyl-carrier-protein) synthase